MRKYLCRTQITAILFFATVLLPSTGFTQSWNQIIKTTAADRTGQDFFGLSVSISGDYAIVGAYMDDEDASGGNSRTDAGSAYIFKNNAGTWTQMQKIVAADRAEGDHFGSSVDIFGNFAIVAAYKEDENASGSNTVKDAGSVYIFENNAGTWSQTQKIVAGDRGIEDYFGWSVAISGQYAIVGAPFEDENDSGKNSLTTAGSAYIFKNSGGTWTQVKKIVANDREQYGTFGFSVTISEEYAIVGAIGESGDISGGNIQILAGAAYIFRRNTEKWDQVQKIVASDRGARDNFGYSVDISGEYAIVGADREDEDALGGNTLKDPGAAYIFENNDGTWTEMQKIVASDRAIDDAFGISVAISGDNAIIGAVYEDQDTPKDSLSDAGAAYAFRNNGGTWVQIQKITAIPREGEENFGISVAMSGDYMIAGAPWGDEEDTSGGNTLIDAGVAYIFKRCDTRGTLSISACKSYTSPSGNYTWTTSGTYIDTISNNAGCDSVVTINLVINHPTSLSPTITVCDSFTWNGNTYLVSGTYIDTFTNDSGCDSIITLNLIINHPTSFSDTVTACNRYEWNGNTYSLSGTYTDTITTAGSCDSVVTLNITINTVDTSVTVDLQALISNASGAIYQWVDCNNSFASIPGETNQSFTPTTNGTFAVVVTENGCTDTSFCYTIASIGLPENYLTNRIVAYPNPNSGQFYINLGHEYKAVAISVKNYLGQEIYQEQFSDAEKAHIRMEGPAGIYYVVVSIQNKPILQLKVLKQ